MATLVTAAEEFFDKEKAAVACTTAALNEGVNISSERLTPELPVLKGVRQAIDRLNPGSNQPLDGVDITCVNINKGSGRIQRHEC